MTTSKHDLSDDDIVLLDRLTRLSNQLSKKMEVTLGSARDANSVKIAGIIHEVSELKKITDDLAHTVHDLNTQLTHDDPQAEHPTSIFSKVRVLWNHHNHGRISWGAKEWVHLIHAAAVWVALYFIAKLFGAMEGG